MRAPRNPLLLGSALAAAMLWAGAGVGPLAAESLRDALIGAYRDNPGLTGARAGQRALDEGVPLARADGLPAASAQASYTENLVRNSLSFSAERQATGSVDLSVPIYSGGAVRNAVRAAKDRVKAGRANLRATESAVFSQTVAAYMDVIRDEAVVDLSIGNVRVLEVNLESTSDRFRIGDLTRTDVAQSEARLAAARSDLEGARANLIRSREFYIQMVGHAPGALEAPPPLPGLPDSPDAAVAVALDNNPDIIAARETAEAARKDTYVAKASALPRVNGFTQASHSDYLDSLRSLGNVPLDQTQDNVSVGVRATIPLFQGGRPGALYRQAQSRLSQALEQHVAIEREVIAQTRASYASWQAALQVIESSQVAVSAAQLSLEGVRAENTVGTRDIIDILNAEQELLNAQVRLVRARRDAYVAGFSLLAAMGKAEARDLGLDGGALYDPVDNYRKVRSKWWDWDPHPKPETEAKRTIDSPAQNAETGKVDSGGAQTAP